MSVSLNHIIQWSRRHKLFLFTVIVPWSLVAIYFSILKTPVYESKASILIAQSDGPMLPSAAIKYFGDSPQLKVPSLTVIKHFIQTRQMFAVIQKNLDISAHYQSKHIDYLSRLKKSASFKDLLAYYNHKVTAVIDPATNELNITVRAFSAETAQDTLRLIIQEVRTFVNHDALQIVESQRDFLKKQLHITQDKILKLQQNTVEHEVQDLSYQSQTRQIDRLQLEYENLKKIYHVINLNLQNRRDLVQETESPDLPDTFENQKFNQIVSAFVLFLILFFLGKMIGIIVREHTD